MRAKRAATASGAASAPRRRVRLAAAGPVLAARTDMARGRTHRPRSTIPSRGLARGLEPASADGWAIRSSVASAPTPNRRLPALVDPADRARERRRCSVAGQLRGRPLRQPARQRRFLRRSPARLAERRCRAIERVMAARGTICSRPTAASPPGRGCSARLARAGFRRIARPARPAAADRRDRRDAARRQRGAASASTRRAPRRWSTSMAGGRWCGWRRRARSAGTRRGRRANGRRPTRCRCSNCSRPMPSALGDTARAKGPARWINAAAHRLRDNAPARRATTSPRITTSATISTPPGSTRTMTYSSAALRRRRADGLGARRSDRKSPRCSTGSTSSPATACSRSAAAGGRWRSRRRSAASTSSG